MLDKNVDLNVLTTLTKEWEGFKVYVMAKDIVSALLKTRVRSKDVVAKNVGSYVLRETSQDCVTQKECVNIPNVLTK